MRPQKKPVRRWLTAGIILLTLLVASAAFALSRSNDDNVWPTEGKELVKSGNLTVDCSHSDQGYVMIRAEKSSKKLKLRLKLGEEVYTYDLNGDGEYEVFPLQMGSGVYTAVLYENKSGKQYATKANVSFNVALTDESAAFLCPSQYIWYTQASAAVAESYTLCKDCASDAECLEAVRGFMKNRFLYDYIRSIKQTTAYLADIDGIYESCKGLCQDFAAIMACMLRVQGIRTQMVIGEVTGAGGTVAHAWNLVEIGGSWERVDITAEISGGTNSEYTPEKYY